MPIITAGHRQLRTSYTLLLQPLHFHPDRHQHSTIRRRHQLDAFGTAGAGISIAASTIIQIYQTVPFALYRRLHAATSALLTAISGIASSGLFIGIYSAFVQSSFNYFFPLISFRSNLFIPLFSLPVDSLDHPSLIFTLPHTAPSSTIQAFPKSSSAVNHHQHRQSFYARTALFLARSTRISTTYILHRSFNFHRPPGSICQVAPAFHHCLYPAPPVTHSPPHHHNQQPGAAAVNRPPATSTARNIRRARRHHVFFSIPRHLSCYQLPPPPAFFTTATQLVSGVIVYLSI